MISTFSVSITMRGSIRDVAKNSSTTRRVFDPDSNITNG